MRQLRLSEGKRHITAFCNFHGIIKGLRKLREERAHLLLALEIEFLRFKFEPRLLPHCVVRLDADEHLLDTGIFFIDIMRIVCDNERDARFAG